jgi:uncharacterized protein YdaU (DUF1376 family)
VRTLLGALLRQGEALKDSFYFKHDYNARNDPKMVRLIRVCGWDGYGVAWAIVEMLYEQGGRISNDPEQIAYELRAERTKVEAVLASKVFFTKDGMIGSERVDRELEARRAAADVGREHALKGWVKRRVPNGGPMGTHMIPNTRRGEERKDSDSANHSKRRCASKEACTTTPMPGETLCSFHQATESIA